MTLEQVIALLQQHANPQAVQGMAPDESFLPFFPLIKQYTVDERNFVKKAVNWALRQIGKCNSYLRAVAVDWALAIKQLDSRAARWIANDALKELQKKTS